jgi:hypothetical protein
LRKERSNRFCRRVGFRRVTVREVATMTTTGELQPYVKEVN